MALVKQSPASSIVEHNMLNGSWQNNNFNLIRLLLAILVIVSHAAELMEGNRSREILTNLFGTISFGELAVDGFFVVSGFLVLGSWHRNPNVVQFLTSRVLRIYPGFMVAVIVCIGLVVPRYSGDQDYHSGFSSYFLELLYSVLKLHLPAHPLVFEGSNYPVLNGSLWSISFEFKAYLAVLVLGFLGLLRSKKIWIGITVLLVCLYLMHKMGVYDLKGKFLSVSTLMCFFVGGAYYLYQNSITFSIFWVVLATFGFVVGLHFDVVAEVGLALCLGYLIFWFAFNVKSLNAFNRLPDISYGVYLYAWPVNKILLYHYPDVTLLESILVVSLISMILGSASWYLVEKPALRIKEINFKAIDWGFRKCEKD